MSEIEGSTVTAIVTPRTILCLLEQNYAGHLAKHYIEHLFDLLQLDQLSQLDQNRFLAYIMQRGLPDQKMRLGDLLGSKNSHESEDKWHGSVPYISSP